MHFMAIITKVPQIILAGIITELIWRQKPVFCLLLHMGSIRIVQCVLGVWDRAMENVQQLLAKTNLELVHLHFPLRKLNYVLASLKVLKSSRAVITTVEENPKYNWTEPACFPAVSMALQQQQAPVIWTPICPLWVTKCHSALCCLCSRSLPVKVNMISDVNLDFYRDLLSHCPPGRGQLNF